MATTLAQLRQNRLNVDLGLDLTLTSGDGDVVFGTTAVRNQAIMVALAKLWPRMARLVVESTSPTTTTLEYSLSTLRDVEAIDLIGGTAAQPVDKANNFRFLYDESTPSAPIRRLRLPSAPGNSAFTSIRVIGYVPYKSELSGDSDTLDLPVEYEWVAVTGARAEIYRRKLNERVNYERFNISNRDNDVTVNELLTLYQVASREFDDAIVMHRRGFSTGHTFRP